MYPVETDHREITYRIKIIAEPNHIEVLADQIADLADLVCIASYPINNKEYKSVVR